MRRRRGRRCGDIEDMGRLNGATMTGLLSFEKLMRRKGTAYVGGSSKGGLFCRWDKSGYQLRMLHHWLFLNWEGQVDAFGGDVQLYQKLVFSAEATFQSCF